MSATAWAFVAGYLFLIGMLIGSLMENNKSTDGVTTSLVCLIFLTVVCVTRAIVLMP